jgi:hypothetical protein
MNDQLLALAEAMKNMKVMKYGDTITLPGTPGETGSASVVINRSDFAWRYTMYSLVTDDLTDPLNFSIDVSLQNDKRFYKGQNAPMAAIFGSPRTGIWIENAPAVIIPNQTTVFITLLNHYAAADHDRNIQVWLVGNEKDKML